MDGKVDKLVKSKHTYSNSAITPFSFYSKEGKILTIKNKELDDLIITGPTGTNLMDIQIIIC